MNSAVFFSVVVVVDKFAAAVVVVVDEKVQHKTWVPYICRVLHMRRRQNIL